jgi:hypothetical protein
VVTDKVERREKRILGSGLDMVKKFVLVYVFIMSVAVAGSLSANLLSPPSNPWIRVVVRYSTGTTITFSGGDSYHFAWMGLDGGDYIAVSCPLFNQGATLNFLHGKAHRTDFMK